MKFSSSEQRFMHRALELAKRGEGAVSPNPMVGAVLVKHERILAEAWHAKFGGPHAEAVLLKKMRKKNIAGKGATLYVNLEPCVTYPGKKTVGCDLALRASGITRVVVAMKDPNVKITGRGVAALRKAGIKVDVGCLHDEALVLNEKFVKWIKTGVPFIAMKVAMSLDGKIATKTGDSKWITSEKSRRFVHRLRDTYDAILVGKNTVLRDNPRLAGLRREPLRIVLDSSLSLPLSAQIFRDSNVLIVTSKAAAKEKIEALKKKGIRILMAKSVPGHTLHHRIALAPLLRTLGKMGISSILVEGGAEIFGSFIDARLVDRLYWFIAPKIVGGREAKAAVAGEGVFGMSTVHRLKNPAIQRVGDDVLVIAEF